MMNKNCSLHGNKYMFEDVCKKCIIDIFETLSKENDTETLKGLIGG